MGRRRDNDDDDDDRDDDRDDDFDDRPVRRPAKSGGGGKTVLIVLLVVGLVLLLIFGVCGFFVYRAVSSVKNAANNITGQLGASVEAESFLSKLSTDQIPAAYESTSPAFKSSMSLDRLQQMINQNPLLTKHTGRRALPFALLTGAAPNRTQTIRYELNKLFDDPEPFPQPGQPKPTKPVVIGPRTITVTVTVAEQPGGFWKVESITVP